VWLLSPFQAENCIWRETKRVEANCKPLESPDLPPSCRFHWHEPYGAFTLDVKSVFTMWVWEPKQCVQRDDYFNYIAMKGITLWSFTMYTG
jgi:hypothetical protein